MKINTASLWLFLVLVGTALVGCKSVPTIHALVDDSASFNEYASFAFHPRLTPEGDDYGSLSNRYIKTAIIREMERLGYRQSDKPDLWVNFNTSTKEKLRISDFPIHHPYYYFRDNYEVWGSYPHYEARIEQYTEGTLNIDVIDRATNTLLWEGIAIGKLTRQTLDNLEQRINEAVALIYDEFPRQ